MFKSLNLLLFFIFLFSQVITAQTYFVTPNGSGSMDGTSWENSMSYSSALSSANGGGTKTFYLKEGTYSSSSNTLSSGNITFKGGYSDELMGTNLCAYNPLQFETEISSTFSVSGSASLTFDGIVYNNSSTATTFMSATSGTSISLLNSHVKAYNSESSGFISCDVCTFSSSGNFVTGSSGGGTFLNSTGASAVTVFNSTYTSNTLNGTDNSLFKLNGGTLDVDNSFFCSNVNATTDSEGACFKTENADVDISKSKFYANEADFGGVIRIIGSSSTTDIDTSEFLQNIANRSGGVIYLTAFCGTVNINANKFDRNQSLGTTRRNTSTGVDSDGGGVLSYYGQATGNVGNDIIYIRYGNKFRANSAVLDGGALLFDAKIQTEIKVEGNDFENNTAGEAGGAIQALDEGTTARFSSRGDREEIESIVGNKFYGNSINGVDNIYGVDIDLDARTTDNDLPRTWTACGVLDGNELQLPVLNNGDSGAYDYLASVWGVYPSNPMNASAPNRNFYFAYDEIGWGGLASKDEGFLVVTNNTQRTTPLNLPALSFSCPNEFAPTTIICPNISGNVYNDIDGLINNMVDGTIVSNIDGTALYANLVDAMGNIFASAPVSADGTYTFYYLPAGNYSVQLTTNEGTVGSPKPATDLPAGWYNSGENIGTGTGSDNTPDGEVSVTVAGVDVTNVNFGVTESGTISGSVKEDTDGDGSGNIGISGVTVTLNDNDGNVVSDTNGDPLTTTTDVNGVYTFENVPVGSYNVETTDKSGYASVSDGDNISDGTDDSDTNSNTNDNSILVSITNGETDTGNDFVDQKVFNISGNVYKDIDGLTNNMVDGTGISNINGSQLYANLVDNGGNVVASVAVNSNGTYNFVGIPAGNYSVQLTTNEGTVGSPKPATDLPAGWSNSGENIGTGTGSDNTPNGELSVSVLDANVTDVNFGVMESTSVTAGNDNNITLHDTPVSGNLFTNDKDPQGTDIDVTEIRGLDMSGSPVVISTNSSTPTKVYAEDPMNSGSYIVAGTMVYDAETGNYTFTPETGFMGTVSMEYDIVDENNDTDTAKLDIKVLQAPTGTNNPPLANNDTNGVVQGGTVTTYPVRNDNDLDGDVVSVTEVKAVGLNNSSITLTMMPQNVYDENGNLAGQAYLNVDKNVIFTADQNYVGEVSFEYTITDGHADTVDDNANITITVEENNNGLNGLYANDDSNLGNQGETLTGNLFNNDYDPNGDDYDVTLIDTNGDGILDAAPSSTGNTITNTRGDTLGVLTITAADGTYKWEPADDFVGRVSIPYEIQDNNGNPVTDDATLYLIAIPNTTKANNDSNTSTDGSPVSGDLLSNDVDIESDNFNVSSFTYINSAGSQVSVTLDDNNPSQTVSIADTLPDGTFVSAGTLTVNTDGSYTYIPATGYVGTPLPISYQIEDDHGATSTALLQLEVLGAPLPVTFVYVYAKGENTNALLEWSTASEINNSHFEVERSIDGVSFEKIGVIAGSGTSNETVEYDYIDYGVGLTYSKSYYRLKQIDSDGAYNYSKIVTATFDNDTYKVVCYPNPVSGELSIESYAEEAIILEIYNATGELVGKTSEKRFDFSNLNVGMYLVKIMDSNKNILANEKVIVVR